MQTLKRSLTNKVLSDVDNVVATVATKLHDAILAAMDSLVVPRVELAMKSVNATSGRNPGSVVLTETGEMSQEMPQAFK